MRSPFRRMLLAASVAAMFHPTAWADTPARRREFLDMLTGVGPSVAVESASRASKKKPPAPKKAPAPKPKPKPKKPVGGVHAGHATAHLPKKPIHHH